ncbi:NAD nucleotidase [Granulosicoccus sp. 3-233]|uniref:NAD nucleotidase n=1 Tax=Granulosicoccus sp. 3-233 TaxID=3417969 RepID=UPI003D33D775
MELKALPYACMLALAGVTALPASAGSTVFHSQFADTYDEYCGEDNGDEGCAEIGAYDASSGRFFTTNAGGNALRVLSISSEGSISDVAKLPLESYGAGPNSVATFNGMVAVAIEADNKQMPGSIVLFDAMTLNLLANITAGALPDMVTFTPDGKYLLVANEGEPSDDYTVDPEGSITIIDMATYAARTATFTAFNDSYDADIRVFGPGASLAQDLEPEYIAVSRDSGTAWVSLQENNAFAIVDIASATVTSVVALGSKDHSLDINALDSSDRVGGELCATTLEDDEQCINIGPQPVKGFYMPDAIASYAVDGQDYIISANEGDARDYDGYSEEARVGDDEYVLDESIVNADLLKDDSVLGRLKTTIANGDTDGDGDYDVIYSYGARSFSIWNAAGELVFDSGDQFERQLATLQEAGFDVWTDNRSDDKGPEPESVTIGELAGKPVAFIGLERTSGVFVYDVSTPTSPAYLGYIDTKHAGDVSPEGLVYIARDASNGVLVVTNELSNTTSTYKVSLSADADAGGSEAPMIVGNTILWESDDYYQVQTVGDYQSVCEGSNLGSCEVSNGTYNVINLTTGERFENIVVAGSSQSEPQVSGNVISWQSADYYQVQSADTYQSLCEGAALYQCTVATGTYHVINHTTGERFENVIVEGDSTGGSDAFSLKILHINDHHSHLEADGLTLDINGVETDVESGGFPRVVGKIKQLESTSDSVLKLHAGDAITGSLYYTLFQGEADAALMNEVCFDAFALGNHEFDDGDTGLAGFLDFLNADDCKTDVLAANVVPELGVSALTQHSATDYIQPYTVKTVNGEKVGIIGIDIANKTKNSSNPDETTQFLDEATTAQQYIDELQADGVNKIVLLTHYQYANDVALAAKLNGVDVIVGGDSHTLLGEGLAGLGLSPQGPYPTHATSADGHPVCVVQAWQYSQIVGELDVVFDSNGHVTACDGIPHLMLGDTFEQENDAGESEVVSGDALAALLADIDASPEMSVVEPDADSALTLSIYAHAVEELSLEVIGTANDDLCLERIPGQGQSQICDVSETFSQGSDISNLVALAFKMKSNTSDIAIQNAGGVRIDIPAGEVTIADAYTLLPFSNTLLEMDMTGQQIIDTLEDALDFALSEDGSTGAYPYASGLRWNIDAREPKGSRFSAVQVKLKDDAEWSAIDTDRIYKVVTNDFIAGGQDGYTTLGEISDDLKVDTFLDYAESFVSYVKEVGTIERLPLSDYSTQSYINQDGELQ